MHEDSRTQWSIRVAVLALAGVGAACGSWGDARSTALGSGGATAGSANGTGGIRAMAGAANAAGSSAVMSSGAGASSGRGSEGGATGTNAGGASGRTNAAGNTAATTSGAGGRGDVAGAPATGGSAAGGATTAGAAGASGGGGPRGVIDYVFVIPMENHDQGEVVGDANDAPFINKTLLPAYAAASNFVDQFAISTPSEPHYVWMEAGTNVFADHTFTSDDVPSGSNSTADTDHLATQIANATSGVSWHSYQQGLVDATGACPIAASGRYVPRHDPFVFFRDVAGDPPSKTNAYCVAHHSTIEALTTDLANGNVATYDFITPDLCNDMHGQSGCPDSNLVRAGDSWLAANVPALVTFVNAHSGVIFIVWDEGDSTTKMPFIAVGPGVKAGYASGVKYTHGSLLKSVEEILGLPVLSRVANENDFADLFEPGRFP